VSVHASTILETTPQIFLGGERVDGYDDIREHFGKEVKKEDETSYQPVVAIFAVALLMALDFGWVTFGSCSRFKQPSGSSPFRFASSAFKNCRTSRASARSF